MASFNMLTGGGTIVPLAEQIASPVSVIICPLPVNSFETKNGDIFENSKLTHNWDQRKLFEYGPPPPVA